MLAHDTKSVQAQDDVVHLMQAPPVFVWVVPVPQAVAATFGKLLQVELVEQEFDIPSLYALGVTKGIGFWQYILFNI